MSWPIVQLKEIASVKGGKRLPKGEKYSEVPTPYPYLRVCDFKNRTIDSRNLEFIKIETHEKISRYVISKDDVYISIAGTIGLVGCIPDSLDGANLTENAAKIVINKTNLLDRDYLILFLATVGQSAIFSKKMATSQPKLALFRIEELEIPLPPLPEQKRIAAILDKADQLRQKRRQAINLADEFLRSVFLEMFGDPVTNPKGWEVRKLSDFYVDAKNGTKCGPFGSALKKHEYLDSGIPVWNMDNITLNGKFIDDPHLWITKEKFNALKAYNVFPGDIIISRAGTVGKMGVVCSKYPESIISTNLIRVRFGNELVPEYFVSLMIFCKGRVGNLKTGPDGSFTHMNTGILDKLDFPSPPLSAQQQYVSVYNRINIFKKKLQSTIDEADYFFNSLSQKAFAGQL